MKKFCTWAAIALTSLVILLAFVPTIISSKWAKPLLLSTVNKNLVGTLYAEEVDAGWLSGLKLKGVTVEDTQKQNIATISTISYKSPLYSLLASPLPTGKVEVVAPKITVTDAKGQIPLNELLAKPQGPQTAPDLTIKDLSLSLDIQKGSVLDLDLVFTIKDNKDESGKIDLKAHATDFLQLQDVLESILASKKISTPSSVDLAIHVDSFPTTLLDAGMQLADLHLGSVASHALGPKLNLHQKIALKNNELEISTLADSSQLQAKINLQSADGLLQMPKESVITYTLNPQLVQGLQSSVALEKPVTFTFSMQPTVFTLSQDAPLLLKAQEWNSPVALRLDTKVTADSFVKLFAESKLTATYQKDAIETRLFANVTDGSLSSFRVTAEGNIAAFSALAGKNPEEISKLIGNKVTTSLDTTVVNSKIDGKWSLQSETIQNSGTLSFDQMRLLLASDFQLSAPVAVKGKMTSDFTIPPTGIISGTVTLQDVSLKNLDIYKVALPLEINRDAKSIAGSVDLKANVGTLAATFSATSQEPGPYKNLPPLLATIKGSFNDLPLEQFSADLAILVGKTVSGTFNAGFDGTLSKKQPLEVTLLGQNSSARASLQLGKELTGSNAVTVNWQLTPERFNHLQKLYQNAERKKELQLQKSIDVKFTCNSITVPVATFLETAENPKIGTLLDALTLDGAFSLSALDAMVVEKKENGVKNPLFIAPILGAMDLQGKTRTVHFSLKTDKTSDSQKSAHINISGQAQNLWDENGIQPEQASIKLDVKIHELPLDVLQGVQNSAGDTAVAVLGKTLNADLKGQISQFREGSFEGTVSSPRLQSNIACVLKEGAMHLLRPITAEYELTPEAGEALLKDINPLLMTAAKSQRPIKLFIDSEDFFIPLRPFSMKEMKIKKIKIDPGIITAKNGGMLSLLVNLLNMQTKPGEELDLWFTPIHVDVKKAVVTCSRADALLGDAFPIATWGSIDLEKNNVEMILGISGQALKRSFGIQTIDPEYLLQIPIRGTTQSPKFDTVRATAKITALKLQQNKSNTTALLGGLLEAAASTRDEPPPGPTTYPFPWQNKTKY
jgi:hypothetical protein